MTKYLLYHMRITFLRTLLPILLVSAATWCHGQVQVTGPDCVVAGTVYQYIVTGPWDSTSTMHVCITGGTLAGRSDSCTGDQSPVPFLQIVWNNITAGTISMQSTAGAAQLQVTVTKPLSGGSIVDSSKSDTIAYNSLPPLIGCSSATGGACSPAYSYQWQLSIDNVQWQEVEGATGPSLLLGQALQKTSYYRRKVTDTASGTIAYSNAARIIVSQPN